MTAADTLDGPRGWRVTVGAMLCLMVGPSALIVASFGTFVEPLSRAFGWDKGAIGFAVSLIAVSIMIVGPLQGVLLDRFGARKVVLLSIPLFAAGFASMAFLPPNLPYFYALWMLLPLLAFGVWPVSYLKPVGSWFDRRLGLAIGVANAGIGFGTIFIPVIAWQMIAAFGVRHAFLGMAALAMLAMPIAALMLHERPKAAQVSAGTPWSYREMAAHPTFRTLALCFVLLGFSGTGLLANLVPILVSTGVDQSVAVFGMSLFGIAALTGRFLTGWLLDRFHAVRVANVFAGASVLAMLLLVSAPAVPLALAGAATLGLLSGAEFDILAYTLRRYFGLRSFGKMYGAIFSLFQLGAGMGAALLAGSVQASGSYAPGLIGIALATVACMLMFLRLGAYPDTPFEGAASTA